MFKSKYSNFLTSVLIIAIVAIIVIVSALGINAYKKYKNTKDASSAISRFDNNYNITKENNKSEGQALDEQNIVVVDPNTSNDPNAKGTRKVTYYNNFVMIGYIEIPSINIRYPILEKETVASLEKSVAVRYPNNPELNTVGNIVIVGHNYRNGMFFSNLKKVSTGDKIRITDMKGQTLVYTVYEKYETTPEDVAYITRNVGDNIEITLVTCTDDSSARIIVKAKA